MTFELAVIIVLIFIALGLVILVTATVTHSHFMRAAQHIVTVNQRDIATTFAQFQKAIDPRFYKGLAIAAAAAIMISQAIFYWMGRDER
jgi:hypothetical protein